MSTATETMTPEQKLGSREQGKIKREFNEFWNPTHGQQNSLLIFPLSLLPSCPCLFHLFRMGLTINKTKLNQKEHLYFATRPTSLPELYFSGGWPILV